MKRLLLILSACLACLSGYAVVASPEPVELTQADGTTIQARLVGDEFHSYYTRMDGTPIRMNKQGMWVNDASVSDMPASARKARRVAQQTQMTSSYPLSGSPKSLVILVNFSDLSFQYTLADFQKMLNESGYSQNGGVGSARDFFIACSDSVFSPQFDCYGPVTISRGYAYYGSHQGGGNDAHAAQMIVEACNKVADQGVDLAQYDTNNDGRLDNVFVYYAGHNEAEHGGENTIWPHRSAVGGSERVCGKLIYDYACTSELRGAAGNAMCGIGTFCHEFGHVLGLPDYYDTDYNYYTLGTWDIMCSGSYNGNGKTPPSYNAGERFQLGWLTPTQLVDAGPYTLEPIENGSKQAYLIAQTEHNLSFNSASPNEYWLLENRQHVGWDAPSTALPGTGMLIWHIDYNASAWGRNEPNNSLPLRYDIEEAGGVKGYSGPSDPFPGTSKVTQFTPMLHNGTLLEQPLLNIEENGGIISFLFKSNGEDNFMFLPTKLPMIESTYNPDNKQAYTPASSVRLLGEHLDPEQPVSLSISGSGFAISKDSSTWASTLNVNVEADSTMELRFFIRYAPRKQVCTIQKATITVRQDKAIGTYSVTASSPRPVLINAPEVKSIDDVTPTSFKVHWVPEPDAEEYYITLYHMEPGTESHMQSFEHFDEESVVKEADWYTSFYRTTTKAKEDGAMSMWFKENNEVLISPIYPLPITKLSMWLNAPATTDTEVGWIVLTGLGETSDQFIDTIRIHKSTKKYTYTHTFSEAEGIRRFRIEYFSFGGEGVCLDAFTTTFNQKIVYTHKGRERAIAAQDGDIAEEYAVFYAYDLIPSTTYHLRLQCSENKGCEEHLSDLSQETFIFTKDGEDAESRHLTLDYDSISYDPGRHVVYLPQALSGGSVCIYSAEGELVTTIPVEPTHNIVVLPEEQLRRGAVYLVKYLPNDKMTRKSPWIKILFR